MSTKLNHPVKSEAAKKVLTRSKHTTVGQFAAGLGVAKSSLYRWVDDTSKQELDPRPSQTNNLNHEKSPTN